MLIFFELALTKLLDNKNGKSVHLNLKDSELSNHTFQTKSLI